MKRTFQRTDAGSNARVSVGAAGRRNADGEGGVVTTAMLSLNDEQEVKHSRVKLRKVLVLEHVEEVLRYGHVLSGMAYVQRTSLHAVTIDVVSVGYDGGETRYKFHSLTHKIVARKVVGRGVESIHLKHAARKDVHDVRAFEVYDMYDGLMVERHILIDKLLERLEIFLVGQIARQKKIGYLLKAETMLFDERRDKLVQLIATIEKLALSRHKNAFSVALVSNHVSDIGKTYEHTAAVFIAQTTFHTILLKQSCVNLA